MKPMFKSLPQREVLSNEYQNWEEFQIVKSIQVNSYVEIAVCQQRCLTLLIDGILWFTLNNLSDMGIKY